MINMKSTSTTGAMMVKNSGTEEFVVGDIVQWIHEHKGRGLTAYGEVSGIMQKNMWVSLLGKEWKVSIHDASLICRPEAKEGEGESD